MLKINQQLINHFIMKKFPKRNIGTSSNGVVLFFDRSTLMQYYKVAEQIINSFDGMKFYGLRFDGGGYKIILNVYSQKKYDEKKITIIKELLDDVFSAHFERHHVVFVCDYYQTAKASKISFDEFREICRTVLKTEARQVLPPMKKKARMKLNLWLAQYQHLKVKTSGQYGSRRLTIIYKK